MFLTLNHICPNRWLQLELYNYASIIVSASTICKLSSLVALQNRYFILQKTLHEILFCGNFFFFLIFSFCRYNLRILRFKLPHVVAIKHVSDINNRKV